MPIYEYQCETEGHRFEVAQKIGSRPLNTCQVCGGKARKIISPTAFLLKGGGWYRDGYTHGKGKKQPESVCEKKIAAGECSSECKKATAAS